MPARKVYTVLVNSNPVYSGSYRAAMDVYSVCIKLVSIFHVSPAPVISVSFIPVFKEV